MTGEIGSTDVQEKRELPEGWRWVKLGDVCKQDRQLVEPNTSEADSLIYYSLEHIESETGRILKSPVDQVEDEGKSTTFRFDDLHVLYGKLRPYLNKVALPLSSGRCTTELIPLLPGESTDRIFLAWLLRRVETVAFAMEGKTGSRMPRADMNRLLTLEIPLPPLPEQQRIAALLKEQMAAVDKARAAAEERLAAIKALPAAFLRQVFPEPDQPLPKGWSWVKLGEVCKQDRQLVEPNTSEAESLIYYSLEHIESETGRILKSPVDQVEDEGKSTTFRFDDRHVLYGKLRPYLNKVALPLSSGRCTTELIPLLPAESTDRIYLAWLLRRVETVAFAMEGKTGSRMPRADMNRLLTLEIPLPPLPEQQRIAALLKEQMAAVEKASKAAEAELETINALPASLLRRAFNGEL